MDDQNGALSQQNVDPDWEKYNYQVFHQHGLYQFSLDPTEDYYSWIEFMIEHRTM